jgi:predicted GH43/DUF377 family glycosyl hydrolase
MLRWRASSAAASVSLAALLAACGPSFGPSQARFTVGPCEALAVSGIADTNWRIAPLPLLEPGPEGSWDSVDTLNPSVVRFQNRYLNLYSGFDGKTWSTGLATSSDGLVWRKHPNNPLLRPEQDWEEDYIAANGSTVVRGADLLHWYQAGPRNQTRIGFAHSADGMTWERWSAAVLDYGPVGSWDEAGLGDPYAIACGEWIYLYYLGQNRRGVQRLGLARSRDGVHWQKSHLNPLLEPGGAGEFDERGLGEPAVFFADGSFWMIYVGRDAGEQRRLGWARSDDGVIWQKTSRPGVIEGDQPWNQAVVCDPEILVDRGRLLILFGGGDRPSPDENLHGRIGVLTPRASQ